MQNRVAIVTGGGTGIGAAEVGNGSIAVQADVADDAGCRALAAAASAAFGRVDFLVNNAGKTKFANHEDLDALSGDDFLDLYRLNVVGAFQMVRACRPLLEQSDAAAVVNIASVAGVFGIGSSLAYACTKGALNTMTLGLARVLAPKIRINAVAPGYVGTGWFEKRLGEQGFAALNQRIAASVPMGFATMGEDVAAPVAMLLDPASRAITGEVLLVDAGMHLDVGLSRRPGREG